jgi:hypothetical protein
VAVDAARVRVTIVCALAARSAIAAVAAFAARFAHFPRIGGCGAPQPYVPIPFADLELAEMRRPELGDQRGQEPLREGRDALMRGETVSGRNRSVRRRG